jgi:NADH-quinone oxidoreductase subunit N
MNPTNLNLADYNIWLAAPEIALLTLLGVILVAHLFWSPQTLEGRLLVSAQVTLAVTLLLVFKIANPVAESVIAAAAVPTRYAFTGMFVVDAMSTLLKIALLLAVAIMLVYSRAYLSARKLFTGEFISLILFATLGMMVMVSANHFVTLYLGLELLALSSYALVALNRDSARSTEAAMKYFILGALASGLLLYGISMVYGSTGSLDVSNVAAIVSASRANDPLLTFGIVFIVAGLAFKLGVVPFHMWVPDVYQGLARHASHSQRSFARRRQHHRDCANQSQTHARVLHDFAHGVFVARHFGRHQERLRVGHVLCHRLRADGTRCVRHDYVALSCRLRGRRNQRL